MDMEDKSQNRERQNRVERLLRFVQRWRTRLLQQSGECYTWTWNSVTQQGVTAKCYSKVLQQSVTTKCRNKVLQQSFTTKCYNKAAPTKWGVLHFDVQGLQGQTPRVVSTNQQ